MSDSEMVLKELPTTPSENNEQTIPTVFLCGKSPVAFIKPAIWHFLGLIILVPICFSMSKIVGFLALIGWIALTVLKYLELKSYQLYYDNDGVWVSSGVMPWNKGRIGVKWRDLDSASYFTGATSWALKSYSLLLQHRFTKSSEISLTNMAKGDTAVLAINELHNELIRQNLIK
jgi:hypothetical protein